MPLQVVNVGLHWIAALARLATHLRHKIGVCITRVFTLKRVILNGELSSAGNKVWLMKRNVFGNKTADFISGIETHTHTHTQPTLTVRNYTLHNIVTRLVNVSGEKYL
jgi:hypothetical protein